jgi:S-adenosyl-L-methionine hydrolase (adenosine-forming)
LLSDFGDRDGYVAAMKGLLLSRAPQASLVDITHQIPPFQVETAACILASVYRDFPPRTVHLAVVDPGVGGARRAIAVWAAGQWFVGPDNGLFSHIIRKHPGYQDFELPLGEHRPSPTFHGRDWFAPAAARLALGQGLQGWGVPLKQIKVFLKANCKKAPKELGRGELRAWTGLGTRPPIFPPSWRPKCKNLPCGPAG